jgi:hypothetical protein
MFQHGEIVLRCNNGSARDFIAIIEDKNEAIKFIGSGVHHQNGVDERLVGAIFSILSSVLPLITRLVKSGLRY